MAEKTDNYKVVAENRKARFEVTANSVQHPIRLGELQAFACPEGL